MRIRDIAICVALLFGLAIPHAMGAENVHETMYEVRLAPSAAMPSLTSIVCPHASVPAPSTILSEKCYTQPEAGISLISTTSKNRGYALVFWAGLVQLTWRGELNGEYRADTRPMRYRLGSGQTVDAAVFRINSHLPPRINSRVGVGAKTEVMFSMGRTVIYINALRASAEQDIQAFLSQLHLEPLAQ